MSDYIETREIPGFDGAYLCDTEGNIYSKKYSKEPKLRKPKGRNRQEVNLSKNNKQKTLYIDSLVLLTFKGPCNIPIIHINGEQEDNKLSNLKYNIIDKSWEEKFSNGYVKYIPGYNGYICDKDGNIYTQWTVGPKGQIYYKMQPKLFKTNLNTNGYFTASLTNKGKMKNKPVHRLVMLTFVGPPNGLHVLHNNGNQIDNRLVNLRYGSPSENRQDMIIHEELRSNNIEPTTCYKRNKKLCAELWLQCT